MTPADTPAFIVAQLAGATPAAALFGWLLALRTPGHLPVTALDAAIGERAAYGSCHF